MNRYSKSFFRVFENSESTQKSSPSLDALFEKMKAEGLAEDASEGGVLSALWKVLKANKSGGTYSQSEIPILQQTIEVCEALAANPYRMHAPGCRVWLSEDTAPIASEAAGAGVPLNVIGFTSKGAAIKRIDVEVESSLRRPEEDELRRLSIEMKGE